MNTVCPHGRLLKLRHRADPAHVEYRVIPCNNWRKCPVCAEKRHRKIRWQFSRVTEALRAMDTSRYYPLMITLTIDPHRYKPYGLFARGLMQVQLNKLMALIRTKCTRQPLFVVRTYEFHKTGNLHCHILLALHKSTRLPHSQCRKTYHVGYVDFHYGYQGGVRQTQQHNGEVNLVSGTNYLLGYAIDTEKSERTRQFHIKGTRYYSLSLGHRLKAVAQRINPIAPRRQPLCRRISIGKLNYRRMTWSSLFTSLGLPRSWLSLLPPDQLSPCLHIRSGSAATAYLS